MTLQLGRGKMAETRFEEKAMSAKQQEGPTRQLSVRLDVELYSDLERVAAEERRTLGNLINLSVKQYLQSRAQLLSRTMRGKTVR